MCPSTHTPARTSLQLPGLLRARLEVLAAAGYPHEACGLLLGRRDGASVHVTHVHEARNLNTARAHDRYELDPTDQLEAEEQARRVGRDVVGIWHSHPDHPPVPSETDRAQAWHGWSYVIVSVAAGAASGLRSWRLEGERFLEEDVLP